MSNQTTNNAYTQVIKDVINKVRDDFVSNGGPGETVLNELQESWKAKMMQIGSILCPIQRSSSLRPTPGGHAAPFHDLNLPYEGTEVYETPTTKLLFNLTPMHKILPGPGQTHFPGTLDSSLYKSSDNGGGSERSSGMLSQFMQPPAPWLTQNQRPALDVNIAYDENQELVNMKDSHQLTTRDFFMISSGKRKREDFLSQNHNEYIPKQNGAGDMVSEELKAGERYLSVDQSSIQGFSSWTPQVDGPIPHLYDNALSTPIEIVNEDYNTDTPDPNGLKADTPAIVTKNDVAYDEDDETLNENDDDYSDEFDNEDDTKNHYLVLAQFDKVTHSKNIWKCTLKDGIMHIENNDILFNKANGEFDF